MWYVMQVRTGTEENIRCQCQRLISSNVLERCFILYYQQKKRFQGEWHIQERILFPGYVFLIAEGKLTAGIDCRLVCRKVELPQGVLRKLDVLVIKSCHRTAVGCHMLDT